MSGYESSSQQTAKTVPAVENPTASSVNAITRIARALAPAKKMNTNMKSESMEPYMPEESLSEPDARVNPSHYHWHPVAEAQEISGHFPHHLGAAIDYIWRVGRKDDPVLDLDKAIRHLEFERARLIRGAQASNGTAPDPSREQVDKYENDLDKNTFFKRP
jgi:hypothetical protein